MFDARDADVSMKCIRFWETHKNHADLNYLRLCEDILENGKMRPTRAKIDGKNVSALTVFGRQIRFPLNEGFPLLTTKKVSFRNIAHELIWLLGKTDSIQYLKDNNVHIWDAWQDSDGCIGSGSYPKLWRKFPCEGGYSDQIEELIEEIKIVKNNPTASCGRRLIVTAWHPFLSRYECQLPACHTMFQFDVDGENLSCQLYQRSADVVLGSVYNIASYSLFTYIIAHLTRLRPYEFVYTIGNAHIYENLIPLIKEQMKRTPYSPPKLEINKELKSIDELKYEDLTLIDYKSHPAIRGEVAV